jgi:hypothetical protein
VRGGGEGQWYEGVEVSYLTCPEVFTGTVNFKVVNQIQSPGRCQPQNPAFMFRQVVWKRAIFPAIHGCKVEYDQELYIIISQCLTSYYYVLMDTSNHIYPWLVSPKQLEPLRMMWTAVCLPNNWNLSSDIQAVLVTIAPFTFLVTCFTSIISPSRSLYQFHIHHAQPSTALTQLFYSYYLTDALHSTR